MQCWIYKGSRRAETYLYLRAAGDTSLCARGHLSGAFVYGEIAAERATAYAGKNGFADPDAEQIDVGTV